MASKYKVHVTNGSAWRDVSADTIKEAREIAESYGATANSAAVIRRKDSVTIALFRRDTSGRGRDWFRANI